MNQVVLDLQPRREAMREPLSVPEDGQHKTLLMAFKRGEALTVRDALLNYGIYALSQRVGELKKLGWPILSEPVKGESYKRYWMDN